MCLLYPFLPTFNPSTQKFFAPFSSESHDFPIMEQQKKKKKKNSYLPTQSKNTG